VGVNRFTRETEPPIATQRIDEALERKQVERVRALRARRDRARWEASLDGVRNTARSGANLMPAILEATESYATVGEIASALREVFGEYQESVRI
jgi:methylmalonyl-CoA mutase, N-terminal domain